MRNRASRIGVLSPNPGFSIAAVLLVGLGVGANVAIFTLATLAKWPSQYLVVRTSDDPERIAPLLKDLVRSIRSGR
jgi:hypothetical protein